MCLFCFHTQLITRLVVEFQIKSHLTLGLGGIAPVFFIIQDVYLHLVWSWSSYLRGSYLRIFFFFSLMCWNFLMIYLNEGFWGRWELLIYFSGSSLASLNLQFFFNPREFPIIWKFPFTTFSVLYLWDLFVGHWLSISHFFSLITSTFILLYILWNFLKFFYYFYFIKSQFYS